MTLKVTLASILKPQIGLTGNIVAMAARKRSELIKARRPRNRINQDPL